MISCGALLFKPILKQFAEKKTGSFHREGIPNIQIRIFIITYGRMIEIYRAARSAAFHPKAVRGHFGFPASASREALQNLYCQRIRLGCSSVY